MKLTFLIYKHEIFLPIFWYTICSGLFLTAVLADCKPVPKIVVVVVVVYMVVNISRRASNNYVLTSQYAMSLKVSITFSYDAMLKVILYMYVH